MDSESDKTSNAVRAIEAILAVALIISGSLTTVISPYYTISVMAILGIVLVVFILVIDKRATERFKAKLQNDLETKKAQIEKEKEIEIAKLKLTPSISDEKSRSLQESAQKRNFVMRKELPALSEFLSQAQNEIIMVGVSLVHVAHQNWDAAAYALKAGRHVKLFVLDPKSSHVSEYEKAFRMGGLQNLLLSILNDLCAKKRQWGFQNLEIWTYDMFPIHSLTILDPDSASGKIKIEYYFYNNDSSSRINITVSKENEKEIYETALNSYLSLAKAKGTEEYKCEQSSLVDISVQKSPKVNASVVD